MVCMSGRYGYCRDETDTSKRVGLNRKGVVFGGRILLPGNDLNSPVVVNNHLVSFTSIHDLRVIILVEWV